MRLHRVATVVIAMVLATHSLVFAQEQASVGRQQTTLESESHRKGRSAGEEAAKHAKLQTSGWAAGSVASNLIIPIGGSVLVFLAAANKDASLPADKQTLIAGEDSVYRAAYAAGYASKLRSRRKTATVVGPIGAAVGAGVYLLLLSSAY